MLLPGTKGLEWRDGFVATGSIDPALLPTAEAIHGERAGAKGGVDFQGGARQSWGTAVAGGEKRQ